ncbi:gamma carbonic anhydrase family protein [uncultured Sphingomonas sp.]|uniref:gamma carbonic anhydrase family protein n=1 Tax=uncultured Sphingomonas sp. TaxID=158754 RepID=UPI0025F7F85F|nr:gamma carbonic anhydrase family protein [uncultured Sphingomonas sp.]
MPLYALKDCCPVVPASAWIAPSADVIGEAILGEGVGIWFGAVLRADNGAITLGERTNVQDGAVLHSDPGSPLVVGADCTIGHRAILHGCTIGDGCLIGMGATILNDAQIGAGSLVGAGALVTEGKVFEPGSLIVGAPARAIRQLAPGEVERLRGSATGYAARAELYAAHLQRLGPDKAGRHVDAGSARA